MCSFGQFAGVVGATVLTLLPHWAAAEVSLGLRLGPAVIVAGPDGVRGRVVLGGHVHDRREHRERRRKRPLVIVYRDREAKPDTTPQPQPRHLPPRTALPVEPALKEPEQSTPLDPGGKARLALARGLQRTRYAIGDQLPGDVPHVTLDAARFDLPRPPDGEIYARVRNQVLRITAADRRVMATLTP